MDSEYVVNVLLKCDSSTVQPVPVYAKVCKPCSNKDTPAAWDTVGCKLSQIKEISQVLANTPLQNPETPEAKAAMAEIINKIEVKLNGEFPLLDPIEHMKIELPRVHEIIE